VSARRLNCAVEQLDAKGVLQFGDRFGDDRIGHCQSFRRPRHAAGIGDRERNVKVAQLDPATDPIRPLHRML
jgi:hypothetical protein